MKNLDNILEIAANLIIEGKCTVDNAITQAIKQDTERILNTVEDMTDMNRDYVNNENKNQKAYHLIMKSVYYKLTKRI